MFVNASSMLSAGVALGAVVFVMASISRRHANAKTAVGLYIKERQQVLVSIALDRWFESRGLTFDIDRVAMEAHTGQSAHATQLAHRIRVEVASQDDRRISEYVSQLQRLNDGVKLTTLTCVNSGAPRRTILWRDNEEPFNGGMSVLWSLQRIIGPGLVFTNERAIGWEKEARRSPGTRLASIDDVESFGEEVFQLTDCADLCMLYDGVALGFDFGCCVVDVESFEALFGKGTPLTSALLVVPLFPPAESITRDTKIHMLFRHFGSCWKHSEIYSWVRKTKKPWTSNCANVFIEELNDMLDEPVSLEDGLSETDIGQFYAAYEALGRLSLDVDFEKLFPSQPADDQRWKDVRITSNREGR
ncbi:MAG: uncharacterized protein KVP18_002535 [Porospora cf. gigantea A]|uniref:uncharacterized protein n=1 Tax=Porospora cf. gigantea A TaxID=2853593 RepID=UPI00355A87CD|nr:MAG: hypothetical protein KVP18_002535 [Porospora cf. gigantea A]